MIRTSVVPTILKGGNQRNVIPFEAEAMLDPEQLFPTLKRIINEPAVDVIPLPVTRPAHEPALIDRPVFRSFEMVLGRLYPKATVLPSMGTGTTDSTQLRAAWIGS